MTLAQSFGDEEYTDCISTEGGTSPCKCPGYDTKQSAGEAVVMLELYVIWSAPLLQSFPGQTGSYWLPMKGSYLWI